MRAADVVVDAPGLELGAGRAEGTSWRSSSRKRPLKRLISAFVIQLSRLDNVKLAYVDELTR